MSLLETKTKTIGGRDFTVRVLPFRPSKIVHARLGKILAMYADDETAKGGVGPFVWASLAGLPALDADIDFYCKHFGPETDVDMGDNRVITLKTDGELTQVFSGAIDEMFEWLDFCVEVNYGALIEKLKGALAKKAAAVAAAKSAPKAEPKSE